ncbi:MAG: ThiF family adenylyltransferase [Planctomycetes bacterium]|nr:ThiF family adenylyltransferase [Planctomycetota bacterium]
MNPLNHESAYRGDAAMKALAAARVCICGAGAVGSTLADALARQGVRSLRVIDRDRVELHNTATQVYLAEHAGQWKVEALKDLLFRGAGVEIEAVRKEVTAENASKLLAGAGLVVDGFDNSAARRAVADACTALPLPCLHVGLNADYGEIRWNERYRVPGDPPPGPGVCDYPLARNLVQIVTGVAADVIVRFLVDGAREDYSVTLKDRTINREDA